jgi:hypothetical protein
VDGLKDEIDEEKGAHEELLKDLNAETRMNHAREAGCLEVQGRVAG